ncbi:TPA_asm: hypothetical protein GNA90_000618 [Salmonella enterica subsp. enterica serovar Enteritidis]|uniref:Uncharacterized protein n=1 Tax=Salmonella enteritidis TaxID=149539 RepID=A0A731SXR5_SALEN|nr:hypothetical protein [Salmonella enterica subsp. enterica serovar Enteritidis]HAE8105206.1 hypothetical protein [Salmonella enterica subsp. enterica serovar Enteritidis]
MCHINIGGREVIDVILITNLLCKKTTNLIFSPYKTILCEIFHIFILVLC